MALCSKIGHFQGFVSKYGVDKSTCPHMFRRPWLLFLNEPEKVWTIFSLFSIHLMIYCQLSSQSIWCHNYLKLRKKMPKGGKCEKKSTYLRQYLNSLIKFFKVIPSWENLNLFLHALCSGDVFSLFRSPCHKNYLNTPKWHRYVQGLSE